MAVDGPDLVRALVALAVVLALILGGAWVLRRAGLAGPQLPASALRRLAVVEVRPLDLRHRLILIRRDRREHLLLIGPAGALVVEQGIDMAEGERA